MSGLLIFADDGSQFDEREFVSFAQNMPEVASVRHRGSTGDLVSFFFQFGGEEVGVELRESLETIVLDSDNGAAFEFCMRLKKHMILDLRVINESYTFDVMLSSYNSSAEMEKAFLRR